MLISDLTGRRAIRDDSSATARPVKRRGGAMEQADIERVRRVLRQRPKPPWRVLWRGQPHRLRASDPSMGRWARRRLQLQAGWRLLWTERLCRDLAPIYRLVACRHGRHRDAHVMADNLVGSEIGDAYPEVAICEVCGRAVDWPNGTPHCKAEGQSSRRPGPQPLGAA
jgi:hypothetical protein